MAKDENVLAEGGIQFFGKMSVAATHEIKNSLAIINESAGLLKDLSMMAEKGHPLSLKRINDISSMVTRQVQRADLVLRKLNQFSHSVDMSTQVADLEKTVRFVLNLASGFIERQGGLVEVTAPVLPVLVTSNLFYLENMIWKAIETACQAAGHEKKVKISFGTDISEPLIWFTMNSAKKEIMDDLFGSKEDSVLMAYLNISIKKNEKNNGFGLLWPKLI